MGVWRRLRDSNTQAHTMGNGFLDRSATNYGISRRIKNSSDVGVSSSSHNVLNSTVVNPVKLTNSQSTFSIRGAFPDVSNLLDAQTPKCCIRSTANDFGNLSTSLR